MEQGNNFAIVTKSDVKARENICSEWHMRCANLMTWPEVQELLKELEMILITQRSMAASYRFLSQYFTLIESLATFRKHWSTASDWIKKNIRPDNLDNVMNLLNKPNGKISQELL